MAFQRQRFEQLRTNCYSSSFATLCERGGTQRHRQRDPMANAPSILYFGAISSAAPSKAAEELVPAAALERRVGSEEDALPSARAARGEAPKRRAHWDRTRLHEDRWLAWQLRQETKLFEPPQSMQSMRRVGHGGRGGAAFCRSPASSPQVLPSCRSHSTSPQVADWHHQSCPDLHFQLHWIRKWRRPCVACRIFSVL